MSGCEPGGPGPKRAWRLVISAMVSEAHLVFGTCFLLARSAPVPSLHPHAETGATLHGWIRSLLRHASVPLHSCWHWTHDQCQFLHVQLSQLASPTPWAPVAISELSFGCRPFPWHEPCHPFPAAVCAFLHSLRVGAPWTQALDVIGVPF